MSDQNHHHSGLLVVNIKQNDTLIKYNQDRYFIPASTAKLFTLYTSLKLMGPEVPTLKYFSESDTVWIMGTGDPTLLHHYFNDSTAIQFLNKYGHVKLFLNNHKGEKFAPGWAWEDYQYYFSPERTSLPLYGNVVNVIGSKPIQVIPKHFARNFSNSSNKSLRDEKKNRFYPPLSLKDTLEIPFITSDSLTKSLLEDKVASKIELLASYPVKKWETLYGALTDSVLTQMLQVSDNFLAEQLMLMASSTLSDTLSFKRVKNHLFEEYLNDIKNEPRWVDGSGLSRYNLFTPSSMIQILQKLYQEVDSTRLFQLMPQWNEKGTVPKKEKSNANFIYAKSGSMGNIYNVCGYVLTKSGTLLAFSYMNNNFRKPTSAIRTEIFNALKLIHQTY